MERLIRLGLRHGWRRGVLGGSRSWVAVGGVALVGHLARRMLKAEPDIIFSEKLPAGGVFRITHELGPERD